MVERGLKGIICAETKLSAIDGIKGELYYRGYPANELAQLYTFEEIAHLLWYGKFPAKEELDTLMAAFKNTRKLPDYMKQLIGHLPESLDMLGVIRTAVSSIELRSFKYPAIDDAIMIASLIPGIIAYRRSQQLGIPFPAERTDLSHTAYYLYMITGQEPTRAYVSALEAYLILTMEHGMNASTFSARVTASTESDLVSAVTSAIGTMKGPLHGGAPSGVIKLLQDVSDQGDIRKCLREKIADGEKLMGFGHRVYRTLDPRAAALKEVIKQNKSKDDWLDFALKVEEEAISLLNEMKPGRNLYTNVEFYAAAILRELRIPSSLFTATFTASRIVGWTAHVLEQREDNVIFRPEAIYTGSKHKKTPKRGTSHS
ncbi:citrate synthase/methylcitrate synthase [Sediminibacillus massiliensis]|uniref:citrate synthase/methylcitrate synthase n=1 Tax=Sediminibacillus massiliensis TaxID=1926277 RepID=UPI000988631B|nr:citrate synthase/methylcitrate synthase [Sediminibacillus massiliensis]